MTVDELLGRLKDVHKTGRGWEALCPTHEDRKRSLTVAVGVSGALLLRCHASNGCSIERIVAAIGITKANLFPSNGRPASRRRSRRMVSHRLALEREVLAHVLLAAERDRETLRRKLLGLNILGGRDLFAGDHACAFAAIVRLADRGDPVDVMAVTREAGGRLEPDYLTWIATSYRSERSLAALIVALLDVERRGLLDSIGRVLVNVVGDPAGDVDRAIATAIAALRRLRRAA